MRRINSSDAFDAGILGRWWTPDPSGLAAVDPNNPQSWNRYAYVNAFAAPGLWRPIVPILLVAFLVGLTTFWSSGPAIPPVNKIYLVKCSRAWCSFRDKEAAAAMIAKTGALLVAQANFSQDKVADIFFNQEAESGNWVVYDHYRIAPNGQPSILVREIRFAEGNRRVRQTFSIRGATVKMLSEVRIDSGGMPMSGAIPTWLPHTRVISNVNSFGFASLIANPKSRLMPRLCQPLIPAADGCNIN